MPAPDFSLAPAANPPKTRSRAPATADAGTLARALASVALVLALGACAATPSPAAGGNAAAKDGAGADASAVSGEVADASASAQDLAPAEIASGADAALDAPNDAAAEVAAPDGAGDAAPESSPPDSGPLPDQAAETAPADAEEPDAIEPDANEPDASEPDGIAPPAPDPAEIGAAVEMTVQLLQKPPVDFAAAAEGAQVLAQAGTVTSLDNDPDVPPVVLAGDAGKGNSVAILGPGQLLLGGSKGIFGAVKGKLLASPLQAQIQQLPASLLMQPLAAGYWLWLLGPTGQWRYDGAVLQAVKVEGFSPAEMAGAIWRTGPAVNLDSATGLPSATGKPVPALWLYWNGGVHALTVTGNTGKLWLDELIADGADLQTDGAGNVWLLGKDGTLHRRDPGGAWQWLQLPEPVTAVAGRPQVPFAAVQTSKGLWLHQNGVFFPLANSAGWQLRDLTTTAALVAVGPQGLGRLVPGQVKPPPPPSWVAVVEPIYKARCATCHGPGAVTVKLPTAADWKSWYDKIVVQIDADKMPLVGQKLTPQEKALIKSWAKGGFAP